MYQHGRTSRSAFGPQSSKDFGPIDVACSTQLSKSYCLPPMAGSPDWERLERLTLEALRICLAGLSTTCSVGWLPCRTILNLIEGNTSCQGVLKNIFSTPKLLRQFHFPRATARVAAPSSAARSRPTTPSANALADAGTIRPFARPLFSNEIARLTSFFAIKCEARGRMRNDGRQAACAGR